MKFTRDSALWWLLIISGVVGFLGGHYELLTRAFPSIGLVWQARIELLSGLLALIGTYLRMSPLRLSRNSELAGEGADPTQTLSITGKQILSVLLPLVLAAGVASGCAASLKQKTVAVRQAAETALELSHDAERRLCSPTSDQTQGIAHCDGAEAKALGLTDARHLEAARLYEQAFDAQIKAAAASKLWRAGDPAPHDVESYRQVLNQLMAAIAAIIPKTSDVVTKLQQAIDEAAQIAKLAGAK